MSMFRARPHHADAAANTATPKTYTLRRPKISPSDPPTSSSAANIRAYDSTIHCTSATDAWKAFCRAGSATLTTVPSINAMLDPRMVAASTIRPLACEFELLFRIVREMELTVPCIEGQRPSVRKDDDWPLAQSLCWMLFHHSP